MYASWLSYQTVTDMGSKKEVLTFPKPAWALIGGTDLRGDYVWLSIPDDTMRIKSIYYRKEISWWQAYANVGARPA